MGKLITRYNRQIEASLSDKAPVMGELAGDPFEPYRNSMESKTVFKVSFNLADSDGNLSVMDDNGITIVLTYEEFKRTAVYYSASLRAKFIGIPLIVQAVEVDEEQRKVYVTSGVGLHDEKTIRAALMRELLKEVKAEKTPVVMGCVITVNPKYALVNILNVNILGIIQVRDWQKGYTRALDRETNSGDWREFQVVDVNKKPGSDYRFVLSRVDLTDDPWESIPEEYLEENAVISVRCEEKPVGKSYWWGKSQRITGIEIMGNYNARLAEIMVSATYRCKIKEVDLKEHIFKVVPFDMINDENATHKSIEFIKKKLPIDKSVKL